MKLKNAVEVAEESEKGEVNESANELTPKATAVARKEGLKLTASPRE